MELSPELIKPILICFCLALLWLLEGVCPFKPTEINRARHDFNNLALGVLNAVVIGLVFSAVLLTATNWSEVNQFGLLHWIDAPIWTEWMLAMLLFDLWQYLWHRMNHRVPLLWRFHAVHHADAAMDASTALRFHTLELCISSLLRIAILPLLGMSLLQLLWYEVILLPVILFHHSNVRIPPLLDRFLQFLIVTPSVHRVHHSDIRSETDSNYASLFVFWDGLFHTRVVRDDQHSIRYGLGSSYLATDWQRVWGMLSLPFKRVDE